MNIRKVTDAELLSEFKRRFCGSVLYGYYTDRAQEASVRGLRKQARHLFWNLVNQPEKVRSNVKSVAEELYPELTAEERRVIVDQVCNVLEGKAKR